MNQEDETGEVVAVTPSRTPTETTPESQDGMLATMPLDNLTTVHRRLEDSGSNDLDGPVEEET